MSTLSAKGHTAFVVRRKIVKVEYYRRVDDVGKNDFFNKFYVSFST